MSKRTRILLAILVAPIAFSQLTIRPLYAQTLGQPLPDGFRGKITYRGTYTVKAEIPVPANQQSKLRIAGMQLPLSPATTTQTFNGAITFEVEYDGQSVTSTTKTTGVLDPGKSSGVRNNSTCEFASSAKGNTSRGLATCDFATFSGGSSNLPGSRQMAEVAYQATATEVVDYAERDKKRAQESAKAAAVAEKARAKEKSDREAQVAESEKILRSLPPIGGTRK